MQTELRPLWDAEVERARARRPLLRPLAAAALIALAVGAVLFTRAALDRDAIVVASVERTTGTVTAWTGNGAAKTTGLGADDTLIVGRSLATGEDGRVALRTITGHSLRLDRGTRVVFASAHEIRLEHGAVYIDSGVEGRAAEGLSVLTAFGRVEEIGTQFEVRLSADRLTVRVREGAIALDAEGGAHSATAGEELTVAGGTVRRRALEPTDAVFDWVQGIAPDWSSTGSRLDVFLRWVAREGGYAIRYADASIATSAPEVLLSGDLAGLAPRQALDVVLPAVGLGYRIEGGTLWIENR
jgi:hypothetical protein